jgi:capsular polysaccharide biosynthesis protein
MLNAMGLHGSVKDRGRFKSLWLRAERVGTHYPASVSRRQLPINFRPADSKLFAHELEKNIPATSQLALENCRVGFRGIIFRGARLLAESFAYASQWDDWATTGNLLRFWTSNYILKKRQDLEEDAIWFTDNMSGAYFHWMTDALPRLFAVREKANCAVVLLPASYKALEYVQPSLAPFKIKEIRYVDRNQVLRCRKLTVPTRTAPSGNYNESLLQDLRTLYVKHFGVDGVPGYDRVYISRKKAIRRKVVNELEIESVLKVHGFRVVCLEDFPFEQQVSIVAKARFIVSNHGAGLTNMLFMAAGGSVLELRKSGDSHDNCYFSLASALELRYFYQLCDPLDSDENAFSADLLVDAGVLNENVELMLAR